MIAQSSKIVEDAKSQYFTKMGKTLSNPETGQKTYWSLINKILNKTKIPVIPPLLENDILCGILSPKRRFLTTTSYSNVLQ